MMDKVFAVSGNKISSLVIEENSLKFSSSSFRDISDFQENWDKKLTLTNKFEVKYSDIKSIKKEDSSDEIKISYTSIGVLPSEVLFSFKNADDIDVFFEYLVKQQYFQKSSEKLSSFKAIRNNIFWLVITIGITWLGYYMALGIDEGETYEPTRAKTRLFYEIIKILGVEGVMIVGVLIASFISYKIWIRYQNPPNLVLLTPPMK